LARQFVAVEDEDVDVDRGGSAPEPAPLWDNLGTSQRAAVRDSGVTVSVVLQRDERRIRRDRSAAVRCTLPLVLSHEMASWRRIGYLPIVPEDRIEYNEELGARMRRSEVGA
jgi:hypothetical protein